MRLMAKQVLVTIEGDQHNAFRSCTEVDNELSLFFLLSSSSRGEIGKNKRREKTREKTSLEEKQEKREQDYKQPIAL